MDKILGEVFDDYVRKQIEVRQRSLGKTQKDVDDLQVFNASTPWIRLSSPISISDSKAEKLSQSLGISKKVISGNKLARNLVLFAGTTSYTKKPNQPLTQDPMKGGVGYGLNNAYGFLSDKEQGYKPMPGITNISTTYKNNGSLKQAQVTITCFTRKQFEALEALYLRLGYTVVLEWGHSIYFDNQGVKQNMSSLSIPNKLFSSEKDLKASALQKDILKNKKETGGNYDGMVAKVSNFSWNLNNDLSYSITLDLISVGDIIDSLKMNVGATNTSGEDVSERVNVQVATGVQNLATIEINRNVSKLNNLLYGITSLLTSKAVQNEYSQITQDRLEFKDTALQARETVRNIRKSYTGILNQLKGSEYETYQNIRNYLLEKVTLQWARLGANISFTITTSNPQELYKLLFNAGYTRYVTYNETTNTYGTTDRITFEEFYKTFGLKIILDAPVTSRNTSGNARLELESSDKSKTMQELNAALTAMSSFFSTLEPINTGDPNTDNIGDIIFLQQHISNNTQLKVIGNLLNLGYLDVDKKYHYPKLKSSEKVYLEFLNRKNK